ncbi:MAG TPA: carboxypeptidase regulatory-like domain-containing protein [Planctomycetota bacterium]|nr:carboxypeptidase regulatory-like domain-containing protein [Planctomycetota bacterium]
MASRAGWLVAAALVAVASFSATLIVLGGRSAPSAPATESEPEIVETGAARVVASRAAEPTAAPSAMEAAERRDASATPPDEPRVANEPKASRGAVMAGRVVDDATGAPISRFWVGLENTEEIDQWIESANGEFRLEKLPGGGQTLIVAADGYVNGQSGPWKLDAARQVTDLIVRLKPSVTIRGRVVQASDARAMGGVLVRHCDATTESLSSIAIGVAAAVTKTDGSFEIEIAREAGAVLRVTASDSSYVDASTEPFEADRAVVDVGTIALHRGGTIEGVALGADGTPVANAFVAATRPADDDQHSWRVRHETSHTGANGAFRFVHLEPGEWNLIASAADGGALPYRAEGTVSVAEGAVARAELRPVRGGCTIRGRVHRANKVIAGAAVSFALEGSSEASVIPASPSVITDDEGQFVLKNARSGAGFLDVQEPKSPSSFTSRQKVVVPDSPNFDLDVDLPVGGVIKGTVRCTVANAPMRDVFVSAAVDPHRSEWRSANGRTDPEGAYRIENLPSGRYALATTGFAFPPQEEVGVVAHEHAEARTVVTVTDGETTVADFALEPASSILVEVVVPDGSHPRSCDVILDPATGPSREKSLAQPANDAGFARIHGVVAGTYVARAHAKGFVCTFSDPVVADGRTETRVKVQLQTGMPLRVRAIASDGTPTRIDGAFVSMGARPVSYSDVANDDGTVTLLALSGSLTFWASSGTMQGTASVAVGATPPAEVVVKLDQKLETSR